jgi:resuscitation-promoting factor RpfB
MAVFVAGIGGAGAAAYFARARAGTDPAAMVVAGIPGTRSVALLEQDRQHMILMDAATKTLNLVGAPKLATRPSPAATPDPAASSPVTPGTPATPPAGTAPPPSPGTAQSIASSMLSSFGWKPSTYFSCLDDIWSRESGWSVTAENASGAYGIPQALPGDKMATAGPDWQTNATTQIKWGLGYIQGRYGDPCSAWSFWQAHGWY